MRFNVYRTNTDTAVALEAGSALDIATSRELSLVGSVETTSYRTFSPEASAFQSNQHDYIKTGLPWPYSEAVVVL